MIVLRRRLLQDGKRTFGPHTALLQEPQFAEQGDGRSRQYNADHRVSLGRICPVQSRSDIVYLGRVGVAPFQRRSCLPLCLRFAHCVAEVLRVPASMHFPFACFAEFLERVGAGRVEQPEPWFGAANIRDNQRFRHQVGQKVYSIDACGSRIHGHRRGAIGGEAAGKDTKSPQEFAARYRSANRSSNR